MTTLPAGVFDELGSLGLLTLRNNQLTTLPVGIFDGLSSLVNLGLSNNQLMTLPDGIFDGLENLEYLGLGYNHLVGLTVDDSLFDELTATIELGGQTNFPQVTDICDRTPQVRDAILDAISNALGSHYDCSAVDLGHVEILRLSYKQLASLKADDFDGLANMETLDLSNNQLTKLPDGVFDGLDNLESLNLEGNHLVGLIVNDPVFNGLTAAIELGGQTESGTDSEGEEETGTEDDPTRLIAAVPLMLSASHSMRQGFVRIVNQSDQSGIVRISLSMMEATRRNRLRYS